MVSRPDVLFVGRSSVVTIGIVVKAGRQGRVEWRLCEVLCNNRKEVASPAWCLAGALCRGKGSFALDPNATSSWHAVARSSTVKPQTGASAPSFGDGTRVPARFWTQVRATW